MYQFLNLNYLNELSEGNTEFVKDMLQTFLDKVPNYVNEFKSFNNEKNWTDLQVLAHKSKSTFLMMGISELSKDAAMLESFCKKEGQKEEHEIDILLLKMEPCFKVVELEVMQALSELN